MSFDESMNKIFQLEQMDLNVRFWDDELGVFKVSYFTSRFFERPNAENSENVKHAVFEPLSEVKMTRLSIDGPNINWKVFDLLKSNIEEAEWSPLMNLGSCSLHIVH